MPEFIPFGQAILGMDLPQDNSQVYDDTAFFRKKKPSSDGSIQLQPPPDDTPVSQLPKKMLEKDLPKYAGMGPKWQADNDAYEASVKDQNMAKIDQEIARAKDPKILATLRAERERLAGANSEDDGSIQLQPPPEDDGSIQLQAPPPYQPWFQGDFTAPMLNRMKEVADNTVDAFKQSPKDAALGLWHGASAGLVNWMLNLSDLPIEIKRMVFDGKSPQEALKAYRATGEDIDQKSKQVITNLLSIAGIDPRDYLNNPPEAFKKPQELLGLPAEPFHAGNEALTAAGHPNLGALLELGGEGVLGGMMMHGALKNRPIKTEDVTLKDNLDKPPSAEAASPPEPPAPTMPDVFEWDKGAARAEQPLGDIWKTEPNPNPIPEGLPRRMDDNGNLIPTPYDKLMDTEISRPTSIEQMIEERLAMEKQDEINEAYRQRDAQEIAEANARSREEQDANERQQRYSASDFEPEQGSRQIEKIQPPNQTRTRYRPNAGSLNMGLDISDLVGLARSVDARLPLSLLRRLRGLFREQDNPNPGSLAFLREKMKNGELPNPEDKPVIVLHDKGAAIYDGNHRIKVADELGWQDMPVTVKDYTTGNQLPSGKGIMEGRNAILNGDPNFGKKKSRAGTMSMALDPTIFDEGLRRVASKLSAYTDKLGQVLGTNHPFLKNEDGTPKVLWHATPKKIENIYERNFKRSELNKRSDIGIHFGEGPVAPLARMYDGQRLKLVEYDPDLDMNDIVHSYIDNSYGVNGHRMIPKLIRTTPERIGKLSADLGNWKWSNTWEQAARDGLFSDAEIAQVEKYKELARSWNDRLNNLYDDGLDESEVGKAYKQKVNQAALDLDTIREKQLKSKYDGFEYPNSYEKIPGKKDTRSYVIINENKIVGAEHAQRAYTKYNRKAGTLNSGFDISSLFKNDKERQDYERARNVVGRMDMSAEDFMKEFPKPTQDIRARGGYASGAFRTIREHGENAGNKNHAIHTLAYIDDQMHLFRAKAERFIVENFHPARLEGLRAWGRTLLTFNHHTFMRDLNAYKQFEKSPETWRQSPDQWYPTEQQLKDAAISPMGARALVAWGKAADAFWPHVVQFAKDKGIPVPDRIPGWIPHFTTGGFKVRIFEELDGSTPDKPLRNYIATAGAFTERGAKELEAKFQRYIDKYGQGKNIKIERTSPTAGNDTADAIKGVFEMQDRIQMNKGLQALLEKAEEQAAIGNLKSAMQRKKNPMILHDLDRVGIDGEFQLTRYQAFKAMHKMYDVLENIATSNMRAEFLTKVLFPLQEAGYFKDIPQLRKAMIDYVGQFLRISDTSGAFLDNWVNDFLIRHGIDPKFAQDISGKVTGGAAAWYLFYKPAFYAVQLAQKFAMQGLLGTIKGEMILQGHKTGSTVLAITKSAITPSYRGKLENGETFKQFAERTGIAKTSYVDNMKGTFMRDPIATAIERQTRTAAFQTSYNFFRQTMSEKDAINAAAKLADQMNVDYSRDLGKPTAFSKEGEWMKPIFMFMQYSLHQLQSLRYQWDTASRAAKAKNLEAFTSAATGLGYNVAMMMALGGLAGLPFGTMLNDIADFVNKNMKLKFQIPTTAELARYLAQGLKNLNLKDDYANFVGRTAEFGLLSQVPMLFGFHGYDVSPSASGPTIQEPTAYFGFLRSLWEMGGLAVNHFTYKNSDKDIGQAIKKTPTPLRGVLEQYIQSGYDVPATAERIKDLVTGKKTAQAPMPTDISLPGDYTRTPEDQVMNLLGLKSLGEKSFNNTVRIDADRLRFQSDRINNLIQQFKENPNDPRLVPTLQELASVGDDTLTGGRDVNQIVHEIVQYQISKQLNETQRRELRLKSVRSIAEWKRWEQEILQQTTR